MRANERAPASIEDAARDVARAVADTDAAEAGAGGWALYGHSMGGLTAFEAARVLEALGIPGGRHLFLSGCPAPQLGFGLSLNPPANCDSSFPVDACMGSSAM
jgi:surfactin synthase thioesterase subunit